MVPSFVSYLAFPYARIAITATVDEEDEETRRLRGDALLDQFKLIEKFLVFWLPEMTKKPSPTASLNQANSE